MKRLGTYRYNIYTMGAFVDIIFSPSKYKGNVTEDQSKKDQAHGNHSSVSKNMSEEEKTLNK